MKKAILTVSFGTTHLEQLDKSIRGVVKAIESTYQGYDVLWAFSSQVIINKLKREHNMSILGVEEALNQLRDKGYEEVVVQPLHLIEGKEYDKVVAICKNYQSFFTIRLGSPLFTNKEDYTEIIRWLKATYDKGDNFLLPIGHGTSHEADHVYEAIGQVLKSENVEGVVSTLQRMDKDIPAIEQCFRNQGKQYITIIPLMLVAGSHIINDIMSEEEGSLYTALRGRGIDVEIITAGLGESCIVKTIFNKHITEAIYLK